VGGQKQRAEVSIATLEAGTTLKATTNWHRHTEKFNGDTHQKGYLPENTYEITSHPVAREERECESTTIHNKGTIIIDPL